MKLHHMIAYPKVAEWATCIEKMATSNSFIFITDWVSLISRCDVLPKSSWIMYKKEFGYYKIIYFYTLRYFTVTHLFYYK